VRYHAFASWPHYGDHLAPIWRALPDDARGDFVVTSEPLIAHMRHLGVDATLRRSQGQTVAAMRDRNPMMVAGYSDLSKQHSRPLAFVEHGAGQSYVLDDGSVHGGYAGGRGRSAVNLFLCPNRQVAAANLGAYPYTPSRVVGSPRLDDLWAWRQQVPRDGATIGMTFHWDCRLCPESGTAFTEFADQVTEFVRLAQTVGFTVIGHAHPKAWHWLAPWWADLGVEAIRDWSVVAPLIDVLVADNSSVMFEACALQIPVVVLQSRWWRTDVQHGMRFWEFANMGPTVLPGDSLVEAVNSALSCGWAHRQSYIANRVYAKLPDGNKTATESAVNTLLSFL
jgi:hypothetical protein